MNEDIKTMASDIDYASTSKDLYPADRIEIAKVLTTLGYGKVEDYKKDIERLKEAIQNDCISKKALISVRRNEEACKGLLTANNVIQQAIKEFAEKLITFCEDKKREFSRPCKSEREINDDWHRRVGVVYVENRIFDLLKEYGIGEER